VERAVDIRVWLGDIANVATILGALGINISLPILWRIAKASRETAASAKRSADAQDAIAAATRTPASKSSEAHNRLVGIAPESWTLDFLYDQDMAARSAEDRGESGEAFGVALEPSLRAWPEVIGRIDETRLTSLAIKRLVARMKRGAKATDAG